MPQILMVEDSSFVGSMVKRAVESRLGFEVYWMKTFADTDAFLKKHNRFFLALLDYNLPDATEGQVIPRVLSEGIPSIVFTGEFRQEVRDRIWAQDVIDYVLKDSGQSIEYLVNLIRRIHRNRNIRVLVVDDSATTRSIVTRLMRVHQYQVFTAENGLEALDVLARSPDIRLVLTDYNMPVMDGFELTHAIRAKAGKQELAIIGLSAQEDHILSARFIKAGANDFLHKPFGAEEFYCRVTQNVEAIEYVAQIQEMADHDALTGLYNRAFFFRTVPGLLAKRKHGGRGSAVIMADIDHFKKVNDTYGHDGGDHVLRHMARVLEEAFPSPCVVARFGGEEFCVFIEDGDPGILAQMMDSLLHRVCSARVCCQGVEICVTLSAGIVLETGVDIEGMIQRADKALYQAKTTGRNRWISGSPRISFAAAR